MPYNWTVLLLGTLEWTLRNWKQSVVLLYNETSYNKKQQCATTYAVTLETQCWREERQLGIYAVYITYLSVCLPI